MTFGSPLDKEGIFYASWMLFGEERKDRLVLRGSGGVGRSSSTGRASREGSKAGARKKVLGRQNKVLLSFILLCSNEKCDTLYRSVKLLY